MSQSTRTNIGVKRMGEINEKTFVNECKKRFKGDDVLTKAGVGCSMWQENLKDPAWHPFKIVHNDGKTEVKHSTFYYLNIIKSSTSYNNIQFYAIYSSLIL